MRQVFSDFLAEHGFLPIPSIGTINLNRETAHFQVGEDIMFPPSLSFQLDEAVDDTALLESYIGKRYRINEAAAKLKLADHIDEIKNALNGNGSVFFNQVELNRDGEETLVKAANTAEFLYPLNASRVIRENKVHEVLVGDVTSNTGAMSDYFSTPKEEKGKKTWLYVLFSMIIIAAAIAAYYYFIAPSN